MACNKITYQNAFILWVFGGAVLLNIYVVCALLSEGEAFGLTGWFVPDGVTLFNAAIEDRSQSIPMIIGSYRAASLLAIINSKIIQIDPILFAIFNIIALLYAYATLVSRGGIWPYFMLFATPYYTISVPLPSKDICVLLMVSFLLKRTLASNRVGLLAAFIVCGPMLFIRDGFAVMLFLGFLVVAIKETFQFRAGMILLALLFFSANFWLFFREFFEGAFIYERSAGVAAQSNFFDVETLLSPTGYFIKLFGNATNLAFRPVFTDVDGNISLLGTAYWISGVCLLYTLINCWSGIRSQSTNDQRVGLVGLAVWFLMAITPYIQPRYLLPLCMLLPIFSFSSPRRALRSFFLLAAISLIVSSVYQYIGNYPSRLDWETFSIFDQRYR